MVTTLAPHRSGLAARFPAGGETIRRRTPGKGDGWHLLYTAARQRPPGAAQDCHCGRPGWVARPESSKGVGCATPTPFEDSGRATRRQRPRGDFMELLEMTWPQVARLSRDVPVVVPIAALEQHGQH